MHTIINKHSISSVFQALLLSLVFIGTGCDTGTDIIAEVDGGSDRKPCTLDNDCEHPEQCLEDGFCGIPTCEGSGDCEGDDICLDGICVDGGPYLCASSQVPRVEVSDVELLFGQVALGQPTTQNITVTNTGDCRLRVESIGFTTQNPISSPDFSCNRCDVTTHPYDLIPGRSLEIAVSVTPETAGTKEGVLVINTDAETGEAGGLISIPVSAVYSGEPSLEFHPREIDFGFVAPGSGPYTQTVTVSNLGTAGANIVQINKPFDGFFTMSESGSVDITVAPLGGGIGVDELELEVTVDFSSANESPQSYDREIKLIYIGSNPDATEELVIPVKVSTLSAPEIVIEHRQDESMDPLLFLNDGDAITTGAFKIHELIIRNAGGAPLNVFDIRFSNGLNYFRSSPTVLPPIQGNNGETIITLFYEPLAAESKQGELIISSNDPANATMLIPVEGESVASDLHDVLTIEVTMLDIDNDDFWGSDQRNVDVGLEANNGALLCTRPLFNTQTGSVQDLCQWDDSTFGEAAWRIRSQDENPKKIVVSNINTSGAADGRGQWKVDLFYRENCSNVPSDTLNDLIDISGNLAGGAIGAEYGAGWGAAVESVIDEVGSLPCSPGAKKGIRAQVRAWAGGAVIAEKIHQFARDDMGAPPVTVMTLERNNNKFEFVE